MRQRRHATIGRIVLLAGLGVCGLGAVPDSVEACFCVASCQSAPPATLFEATVAAIEPPDGPYGNRVVRLADVRAIRGDATPDVIVSGDAASCSFQFVVGVRYLIDAHEFQPGRFGASNCSHTRPLSGARGLLDYLLAPSPEARPRVWGTLTTRVADPRIASRGGGPPVGGAVVTLRGPVERRATAAPDGSFSFRSVPDGDYQIVVDVPAARTDVEAPSPHRFTLSSDTECVTHDLLAAPTARASGLVVTESGAPAAGVRVELFPVPYDHNAGGYVTAATTDAAGRYEVGRIAPGTYGGGVAVPYPTSSAPYAPTHARDRDGAEEIAIAPGAAVELLPITARAAPRMTVAGVVVGPPAVPVDRLLVMVAAIDGFRSAWHSSATTGPSGQFTLDEVHRGVRYEAIVEQAGRIVGRVEFVAGDEPITVRIGASP